MKGSSEIHVIEAERECAERGIDQYRADQKNRWHEPQNSFQHDPRACPTKIKMDHKEAQKSSDILEQRAGFSCSVLESVHRSHKVRQRSTQPSLENIRALRIFRNARP